MAAINAERGAWRLFMESKTTKEWRCFFCDELFVDREKAAEHFGSRSYDPPLCLADKRELITLRGQRDALERALKSVQQ